MKRPSTNSIAHVGPAVGREAAVEQPGDAGMFEAGEDLAFGMKARHLLARFASAVDASVPPAAWKAETRSGFIDLAHAAVADLAHDAPRAPMRSPGSTPELAASAADASGIAGRLRKSPQAAAASSRLATSAATAGSPWASSAVPGRAFRLGQLEQAIEPRVDPLLLCRREAGVGAVVGGRREGIAFTPGRARRGIEDRAGRRP